MKQTKQPEIVDKLDADLMWWFYGMIELHFDCKTIVIDSTEVRKMIKKALQSQADKTRGEVLEEVRKMRREPWQNEFDDRDLQNQKTGYNEAIDDVINKLKKK